MIVWAASHAVGIGFLIDIAMVVVIGVAVLKAFEVMWDIHKIINGASNKADLDRAAKMLAGEIPKIPLNLALLKSIGIRGVFWGTWTMKDPKAHQANMGEILGMYKRGKIKPRISGKYPLEEFAKACDELTQRRAMGKVILTME